MPPCGKEDLSYHHMRRRHKEDDDFCDQDVFLTKKNVTTKKQLLKNSYDTYKLLLLAYPITLYPKTTLNYFCSLTNRQKLRLTFVLCFVLYAMAFLADGVYSQMKSQGVMYTDPQTGFTRINSGTGSDLGTLPRSSDESFAVVINTYKRPDMLNSALHHWIGQCGVDTGIGQVFVVWSELDVEPPSAEDILKDISTASAGSNLRPVAKSQEKSLPTLEFIRVPKDSLNSRFLPISNLKSEAVFMVDDDVRIDCPSLKKSFHAWRFHPNALVGFFPRLASLPLDSKNPFRFIYHTWPLVYFRHRYNIILTKASFLHSKYLDMYFDEEENPKEVLEYVDKNFNCEDIAMAFLIARKTKDALVDSKSQGYCRDCPMFTNGLITDKGLRNGISTSGGKLNPLGHMEKRSKCLSFMADVYKEKGWEYPLFDVKLDKQSWDHHLFWWQYSPSVFWEWFSVGNTFQ
jgi:glucuronyl/N-acetylglucosaminyl transferase EXT2